MKPTPRVGQEWEKAHCDGWNSPPTRIRVVSEPVGGRVDVESLMPSGKWGRRRSLIAAALSNTPKGYQLVKETDHG